MKERRKSFRRAEDKRRYAQPEDRRMPDDGDVDPKERRRRTIRSQCEIVLELQSFDGRGRPVSGPPPRVEGRVLDLSIKGACVQLQQPIENGQTGKLHLGLYDGRTVNSEFVSRWSKPLHNPAGGCAIGVEFTNLTEGQKQQLRDYLSVVDATLGIVE